MDMSLLKSQGQERKVVVVRLDSALNKRWPMGHFMPWISVEKVIFVYRKYKEAEEPNLDLVFFLGGEDDLLLDAFLDNATTFSWGRLRASCLEQI